MHAALRSLALALGLVLAASAIFPAAAQVRPTNPPGGGGGGGSGPSTTPRLPPGTLLPGLGDGSGPLAGGGGGGGQPQGQGPSDPNLICVVFRAGTPDATSGDFADAFHLRIEKQFELSGLKLRVFLMRIPDGSNVADVLKEAGVDKRPLWMQRDLVFRSMQETQSAGSAAGSASSKQYALQRIRADGLPRAVRGQNVTVALIDSGVATRHESLQGDRIVRVDLVEGGEAPPAETHGTAIASIIAGSGKVQGVAPGISLLAIRAFSEVDPATGASESDSFRVSQAVSLALDRKARIINLSIGGPNDPLVRMAVEQAVLTGVVVVAAAGNDGPDAPPVYPAAQTGVIAVTATDAKDRIYDGANRGDYVAIAAPGVDVLAARPGASAGASAYDFFTGTSMATGYATGLAAVLLSANPKLNAADLRHILEGSAADLGPPKKDPEFGWGRIDAAAALSETPTVGAAN